MVFPNNSIKLKINLMNRRNLLKQIGIGLGTGIISMDVIAKISKDFYSYLIPGNPGHKKLEKPVTAIVIGAGSRGSWALIFLKMKSFVKK